MRIFNKKHAMLLGELRNRSINLINNPRLVDAEARKDERMTDTTPDKQAGKHTVEEIRSMLETVLEIEKFFDVFLIPGQRRQLITIIDKHTAAERDKLKGEKAELVEGIKRIEDQASKAVAVVSTIPGDRGDKLCAIVTCIRNKTYTLIAKHDKQQKETHSETSTS